MFGPTELAALVEILRVAGQREIMPRFRNLAAGAVREKSGPLDLVTEADKAAERAITAGPARRFLDAFVAGKGASSADPSRLAWLADAKLAFVSTRSIGPPILPPACHCSR